MHWFNELRIEIQVAIIGFFGSIVTALISGLLSLLAPESKKTSITQKIKGNNNTIIGIQNNTKEREK